MELAVDTYLPIPGITFSETPIYWKNFINYYTREYRANQVSIIRFNEYTDDILINEYSAVKFYKSNNLEGLSFKDPAMMSLFILRWS